MLAVLGFNLILFILDGKISIIYIFRRRFHNIVDNIQYEEISAISDDAPNIIR